MRKLFMLIFICPVFCAVPQDLHSPSELIQMLESSGIKYNLEVSEVDQQHLTNPEIIRENIFYRTDSSGIAVTRIYPYELGKKNEIKELFQLAEDLVEKGGAEESRNLCIKILGLAPDYYRTMTLLGKTYVISGQLEKAAEIFENTIFINDLDFMAHWYLAEVYLAEGQYEKAVYEIIVARILNRNHPEIELSMEKILRASHITYKSWSFIPQMRISRLNDSLIHITCRSDWLGYALCKALWLHEPGYAEKMGVKEGQFSICEERECLANYMVSVNISKKKYQNEKVFLALNTALEKNLIAEYIYYEIWLPQHPVLAYKLPTSMIERIALYFIKIRTSKHYNFIKLLGI